MSANVRPGKARRLLSFARDQGEDDARGLFPSVVSRAPTRLKGREGVEGKDGRLIAAREGN